MNQFYSGLTQQEAMAYQQMLMQQQSAQQNMNAYGSAYYNSLLGGMSYYQTPKPSAIKCDYCGRYGKLGVCEGCGAPNKP